MKLFSLDEELARQATGGEPWWEFLRVRELSVGIYALPAGSEDGQYPHGEGEVYYVLSGQGHIRVGDEERPVCAGDLVYVPALVEHRFFDITAELTTLVFFAPAEGSVQRNTPATEAQPEV